MECCRIILVEDAQIVREPLARLLKSEGFEVAAAADGAEAMVLLQTQGADLILLDVLMPRMHGVAFLEALRGDARFRDVPVIGLTGISDTSRLARLRELGVKTIVHKVRFTFEGLLEEIRHCLPRPVAPAL
ncbi:MAG TPA: response regulator [Tepidisphaeraceae bacterium]|nr:response regulator [Tepidisphaeraceae bacterium]